MSDSAYLTCPPCRVLISLGKPVLNENGSVSYFHLAGQGYNANSENPVLTKAVWRFLADHSAHSLRVRFSHEPDFETVASFSEIGGDEIGSVTLEDYIRTWPG